MTFAYDCCAIRMNRDPDSGDIDRHEGPAVLAGMDATGLNRLPVPTIKTEDPVGLRNRVPAFDVGQFAAMGLAGADIKVIEIAPQRLHLFCREAHHRTLTLRTGSGLERVAPATSAPPLRSRAKTWRRRRGSPGSQYVLGTASSLSTTRAGSPGLIEAVKSGAVSFLRSSSTITSLAIWRRLAARSCSRSRLSLIPISEPTRLGMISCAVFCLQ